MSFRRFSGTRSSQSGDAPDRSRTVAGASSTGLTRRRAATVWMLIAVASVLGLLAILSTWINRQILDGHAFARTSEQLVQDPAIQSAVSVALVNGIYDNVNVAGVLQQRLPPRLKPLASPAAVALRQPAENGVKAALSRPRLQALWVTAAATTQRQLVNVLEDRTRPGVSTANGTVTLDLGSIVKNIGPEVGLPAAVLSRVPPSTGSITVMHSNQLALAQTGVRTIRFVSVWLVVLVFAMFALAVYLAAGARRRTLRNVGWALVSVGIVVLFVRRAIGNYAVNGLAPPSYRVPAHHAWLISSTILAEVGWATILYGAVAVFGATLAGPTRVAVFARRQMAPILVNRPYVAWSVAVFAYLLLVLWGGTHALRTWWGVILLGALLALGVEALRRQAIVEYPSGRQPAEYAAASTSSAQQFAAAAASLRTRRARPTAAAEAATAQAESSRARDLVRLTELHDSGALSDLEFTRAKNLVLS